MPVLLPNLTFDIWRGTYHPSTGVTTAETLCAKDQSGHIHWETENDYIRTQATALLTTFLFYVGLETDIREYDILKNIRLNDAITPWLPQSANEFWRVTYIEYSPQPFLPHRDITVTRVTGGGPAV